MDVHFDNWRFWSRTDNAIIHLLLPQTFFELHNIPFQPSLIFWTQTRFHNFDLPPTPYVKTWGKQYTSFPGLSTKACPGIAVSLVVNTIKSMYNPFDMTVLKILHNENTFYIKFFHMELFADPEVPHYSEDIPKEPSFKDIDPIDAILSTTTHTTNTYQNPLGVLTSLLQRRPQSFPTHHFALEDPGQIRGYKQTSIPSANKARPSVSYVKHQWWNITTEPVIKCIQHVLTKKSYFICYYSTMSNMRYTSVLETIPIQELTHVNPTAILDSEKAFLFKHQHRFVNLLEHVCKSKNYTVKQHIPVLIHGDEDTTSSIKDHFIESCFVLESTVSEASAWVRATFAKYLNKPKRFWIDYLRLWEEGTHLLGKFLPELEENVCEERMWNILSLNKDFINCLEGQGCTCVLVDSDLNAWLILPGGFVIKGQYNLTQEDILFVGARYG
ncbi:orf 32 [Ateline gammaherpesvirus 3]|uniref:Orf 32 n=1 Tax=Ateline herpesvirus 3 TaxID=85618 RepID=Q9YTN4_ATHV3|nr:orf 32 [Ateline gammaherpesvirus 3]AAC95558.1 orf 32 [Ateline gammaherpesvirus 3]